MSYIPSIKHQLYSTHNDTWFKIFPGEVSWPFCWLTTIPEFKMMSPNIRWLASVHLLLLFLFIYSILFLSKYCCALNFLSRIIFFPRTCDCCQEFMKADFQVICQEELLCYPYPTMSLLPWCISKQINSLLNFTHKVLLSFQGYICFYPEKRIRLPSRL